MTDKKLSIPSNTPVTDKQGRLTDAWLMWFNNLYKRVGSSDAKSNAELSELAENNVTSINDVNAALEANLSEINALKDKDLNLDNDISNLKNADTNLNNSIESLNDSIVAAQNDINDLETYDVALDGRIDLLETDNTALKSNTVQTITNIGTGAGIFKNKTTNTANLKTLRAGTNITLDTTTDTNAIIISSTAGSGTGGDTTAIEARLTTAENNVASLQNADISLDTRLDTAEADITALKGADTALDGRLDTAENDITLLKNADITITDELAGKADINHTHNFATADDITANNAQIYIDFQGADTALENRIATLEAQPSGGDTTALENRIVTLENSDVTINNTLISLDSRIDTLEANPGGGGGGDTSAIEADIADLKNADITINNTLISLDSRIDTLEANPSGGGGGDTTALEARITTAENDINALESANVTINNTLANKSDIGHTHDYVTDEELATAIANKSDVGHTHAQYLTATDKTALENADTALDGRLDTAETDIFNLKLSDTSLDTRLDGAETDIDNLEANLANKSDVGHVHNQYLTTENFNLEKTALNNADTALDGRLDTAETNITNITTTLANKSDVGHTHDYVTDDELNTALANKADIGHTHADYVTDTELATALSNKSDIGHTHNYEPANANIQSHISDVLNPHGTTAAQVGAYTKAEVNTLIENNNADTTALGIRVDALEDNAVLTITHAGSGVNLVKDKTVNNLNLKTIKAGTNITIDNTNTDEILISSTGGGGSEAVTDEQVIQAVNYSLSPSSGGPGVGTITVVGTTEQATLGGANNTTISQNAPSNIQDGDALFAFVGSGYPLNMPAGWTLITSETRTTVNNTSSVNKLYLFRKIDTSSVDSNFPFSFTQTTAGKMSLNYIVLRSSTGVVDVRESTTKYVASASTITMPGLTATDNEIFIMAGLSSQLTSSGAKPSSIPTGWTLYSGEGPIVYYNLATGYQALNAGQSNNTTVNLTQGVTGERLAIVCRVGVGSIEQNRTLTPLNVFSKDEMRTLLEGKLDAPILGTYELSMGTKATGFAKYSTSTGSWTWDNNTYSQSTHNHNSLYLASTGGQLSGDLAIAKATIPALTLWASSTATTHNKTVMVNDAGNFRYQTYTGATVFVSNDYLIDRDSTGAILHRMRTSNVDKFRVAPAEVTAGADNVSTLGSASIRWNTIFSSSSVISTSDRNLKTEIKDISEAEKLVAMEIKKLTKTFKYKDAVAEKGDKARIHVGFIAQEIEQAFINHGLNPREYALFCEDIIYHYEEEEVTQYEVDGEIFEHKQKFNRISKEPVDGAIKEVRLSLRYEQILTFLISVL